jgi:hypothetical protein
VQQEAPPEQKDLLKGLAATGGFLALYLFWFSYVRARAFYGYFGVAEAVGLQFRDEANAARTITSLFAPLIIISLVLLLFAVTLNRPKLDESHPRLLRIVQIVSFALGIIFMLPLVLRIFGPGTSQNNWLDVLCYSLGLASLLLFSYGVHLRRRRYRYRGIQSYRGLLLQRIALVASLLVLALALSASYAVALGRTQAQQLSNSTSLQKVTIYSKVDQRILGTGVTADSLAGAEEGGYRYRYSGLRLLAVRDSKLILLARAEIMGLRPTVILVDDNNDIRVDITY